MTSILPIKKNREYFFMRKIICVVLGLLFTFIIHTFNNQPTFINESDKMTLYIGNNSSTCQMVLIDVKDYHKYTGIAGESVSIEKQNFNLSLLLQKYCAQVVFAEQIAEGVNYYCYSPKLKYRRVLNGKIINLHVFVGQSWVSIGTPMIFGSF